jgi:purine-nucleoside phosphorylase
MSLSLIQQARPQTAVILGSGMGQVAEAFGIAAELAYSDVPEIGTPSVPGHAGRFVLGKIGGQPVLLAQGRRHLYEGLSAYEVAAMIRFLHGLGIRRVVLTNAAGAIDSGFHIGGLMLIRDHLNFTGQSPLVGAQFHDMTCAYSQPWRDRFKTAAQHLGLPLHEGVYAAVHGPQYETPAEIQMLRVLGAHAVGMSTVPEVIQARALEMEVAGLSLLTNWAAGLQPTHLDHAEVVAVGAGAAKNVAALLKQALAQ